MSEFVRDINYLSDVDEAKLAIGVDHGEVVLSGAGFALKFDLEATELLALSLLSAAWEAGRDSALMEAVTDADQE